MANLLTAVQLRTHVETDLVDDALQQIIDADDAEIIRRLGPVVTQTQVIEGGELYLSLTRAASSVASISERFIVGGLGVQDTTLAASDYDLLNDGFRVERLLDGTNPSQCFRGTVTVAYVPLDTTAERKMLLVKLVKLDLNYAGLLTQSVGDVRTELMDSHANERAALFRPMATGGRRLIT